MYYDRLKLQVLCVLLSLVLTEEKEAAQRKKVEEEKERQSKRAIKEPKYQPKCAYLYFPAYKSRYISLFLFCLFAYNNLAYKQIAKKETKRYSHI